MTEGVAVIGFVVMGCLWLALVLIVGLHALSKADVPVSKGEAWCCRVLNPARILGVKIMSVVDEALARLTTFIKNVSTQLVAARQTNAVQTGKLNELQLALETALSDDAADKARIAALQVEISELQNSVAAQINAVVDALENPPLETPVVEEAPVVEETPVVEEAPVVEEVAEEAAEEVVVVEDTAPPVDGSADSPVE